VETSILELDPPSLRPALKALILALLPGLEEETSEDFDTALQMVEKLRQKTCEGALGSEPDHGGQYFWQCLFLASITNPTRRMGVLAYLNRHFPKLGENNPWATLSGEAEDFESPNLSAAIDSLTSPEPGLLVRCFASGLSDEQLLVQRNFLDLLVTHLPLHSPVLQKKVPEEDLKLLISAASGVVTRRDMSLNRRLWAWLLGPDTANGAQENENEDVLASTSGNAAEAVFDTELSKSKYFAHFGYKPLVLSIQDMINRESLAPSERSKPFRISLSLMDRWEVGGLVVPRIFVPVMRSVQKYRRIAPSSAHFEEVFRSASAFFDGVETNLIFSELLALVRLGSSAHISVSASFVDDLKLANFVISHFNLKEEEMLVIHNPLLILSLLLKMRMIVSMAKDTSDYSNMRQASLDEITSVVQNLLALVPGRSFTRMVNGADSPSKSPSPQDNELPAIILDFYAKSKDSLEALQPPFGGRQIGELLLRQAHSLVLSALASGIQLKERLNLLISLLEKVPISRILDDEELFQEIHRQLRTAKSTSKTLPFSTVSCITSAITTLYTVRAPGLYINYDQICAIVPLLVFHLWEYLSPLSIKFHVEAVRCLWQLHSISWQDHLVEASIASLMVGPSSLNSSHVTTKPHIERFFVLWGHINQVNLDYTLFRATGNQASTNGAAEDVKTIYLSSLLDRPLFIVLDQLSLGPDSGSATVKEWLQDRSSVYR
jgi:hypothetical protein